jgi:hypothetical protein
MKRTLILTTAILGIATVAYGETYKFRLLDPVVVDGKELKAGDYKIEVKNTTAVIRTGRNSTEVKVRIESNKNKYDSTAIRYSQEGGTNNLEEIHIGGTKTNLVFDSTKPSNGGE